MSNDKHARRDGFRPKVIALSVAACFSLSAAQALANPTGGTVVSGTASFANSGNTLTITNSANAIINWQNFSIGVNEITRFLQTSGSSAVLNRVVGANGSIPQSIIDGVLSSNGRVFLINPSGVVIGSSGRIDVAGFIASSLNLSNADFLAGRMRFTETPGAGKVSNAGTIDTSSAGPGGRVWLIGPDVENSGVIRTPQGEIILAAGKSVELVSESSPFVTVNIVADSERALNVGQLLADSGRIGMFGALVRQSGLVQADSAVVGANGEIRLVATRDLTLDEGSRTTANGPGGGTVTLQAQGGTNLIYGTVEAKGASGQGGTIEALGVRVGVLGHGVIDASGDTGGGTVLVGGDQHGANPNIQNAEQTLIGPDGVIRADAATTGDGGRVIVWSDSYTQMFGSASARGGAQSGNGGFIETSSGAGMDLTGVRIDARAPNGTGGTWLIDPLNVVIEPNAYVGGYAFTGSVLGFANNPGQTLHITEATIESNFTTVGNTSIQATQDVLFNANLNLTFTTVTPQQTFEVRAVRNIDMAADGVAHSITTNGQNVTLSASDIGTGLIATLNPNGTGSIVGGGTITTNGGNVNLSGYGISVGAVSTSPTFQIIVPSGNVTMQSSGGDINTGSITTRATTLGQQGSPGGTVALTTAYGNILVSGSIDSRGGNGVDARSSAQGTDGGAVILQRTSTTTTPGKITVTGDILTSGGDGAVSTNNTPNGGTGGYISIGATNGVFGQGVAVYGDVLVGGNMITRGGNAGSSLGATAVGGYGGAVLVFASNNLQVGSSAQNVIDTSGGNGAKGAPAVVATLALAYGGGVGGNAGQIIVRAGTPIIDIVTGATTGLGGGKLTINSSTAANGGLGGAGGDGTNTGGTFPGAIGGAGGIGGQVQFLAGTSVNVGGSTTANGGAAGNGGALSGNGGNNGGTVIIGNNVFTAGQGGTINIGSQNVTVRGNVSADGGAGGAGAAFGGGGTQVAGNGGQAGNGGAVLIGPFDANPGGSVNIGSSGAPVNLSARGGAGGVGGAGDATHLGGNGGYGGRGGIVSPGGILPVTVASIMPGTTGLSNVLAYGSIVVDGGSMGNGGAFGGNGGDAFSGAYGNGGNILAVGAYVSLGALSANGGAGGAGGSNANVSLTGQTASVGNAGGGANGGQIVVIGSAGVTTGNISASGAAGGAGGSNNIVKLTGAYASLTDSGQAIVSGGGNGGAGGNINLQGDSVSTGTITLAGGDGGAGGAGTKVSVTTNGTLGNQTSASAIAAVGGQASGGGQLAITASTLVKTGTISAAGGAGGAGGGNAAVSVSAYGAAVSSQVNADVTAANGGNGGSGGSVSINNAYLTAPTVTLGTVSAGGGAGGIGGGGANVSAYATGTAGTTLLQSLVFVGGGNVGGFGGDIGIFGAGTITTLTLDVHGGSGGAAGLGNVAAATVGIGSPQNVQVILQDGGSGGSAGFLDIQGTGITINGDILAYAGNGGNGVDGSGAVHGSGGGFGGSNEGPTVVTLDGGTGAVTVTGTADLRGGTGGVGGANGGRGGSGSAGSTLVVSGGSVSIGSVMSYGGAGGNGGAGSTTVYGGNGGQGGSGGGVLILAATGDVTIGAIDTHGGAGGSGGANGGFGGSGGSGTNNAFVQIPGGGQVSTGVYGVLISSAAGSVSVGSVNVSGGAGAKGGADLGVAPGAGDGGFGGRGAYVQLFGAYGVAAGTILAAGGAAGDGGKGNGVRAGIGGGGGAGGLVTLQTSYGTIDLSSASSISVAGGRGGNGGAGDPVQGGAGGNGGYGGTVDLFNPYGSILVASTFTIDGATFGAGPVSTSLPLANGGAGGAGGADFGLGAGLPGLAGISGSAAAAGTIEILSTSLGPEGGAVIQGTNQLLTTNNAPSSDDLQKKNEDNKKKNQVAACK